MSLAWTGIILLLAAFYALFVMWLFVGFGRLSVGKSRTKPTVSVVVAARNEEDKISECLDALVSQDYPAGNLEIIIVDDRSQDRTAEIVTSAAVKYPQVKLCQVFERTRDLAPKKRALDLGIRNSRGEIIVTTDADCRPGPGWISGMISYFEDDVGMVAGFSPVVRGPKSKVLSRLLELDSLSLACVAAGSIGGNYPLTGTGRNLAYRKDAYIQVGGFSHIGRFVSGDDDLLLHLISSTDWRVRYATDHETIVPCSGPTSVDEFRNQRVRHASKGLHYGPLLRSILAIVYAFNVLLFLGFPLSLIGLLRIEPWLIAFAIKTASEFTLVTKGAHIFRRQRLLAYFPLAAMLHVPYVICFAALGSRGRFFWKDEQVPVRGQVVSEES